MFSQPSPAGVTSAAHEACSSLLPAPPPQPRGPPNIPVNPAQKLSPRAVPFSPGYALPKKGTILFCFVSPRPPGSFPPPPGGNKAGPIRPPPSSSICAERTGKKASLRARPLSRDSSAGHLGGPGPPPPNLCGRFCDNNACPPALSVRRRVFAARNCLRFPDLSMGGPPPPPPPENVRVPPPCAHLRPPHTSPHSRFNSLKKTNWPGAVFVISCGNVSRRKCVVKVFIGFSPKSGTLGALPDIERPPANPLRF